MSQIPLLQTLCDIAKKCVKNQVTAMWSTHIVDFSYVQYFCSPHFPSKCPHSFIITFKEGLYIYGIFFWMQGLSDLGKT